MGRLSTRYRFSVFIYIVENLTQIVSDSPAEYEMQEQLMIANAGHGYVDSADRRRMVGFAARTLLAASTIFAQAVASERASW
jgi:hypothetical protein